MQLFEDLKSYVGFQADDVERLRQLEPVVAPHVETVVGEFFDVLRDNPHSRGIFEADRQPDRLRELVRAWIEGMFGGVYDDAYCQRCQALGESYIDLGLKPQYIFSAKNRIRVELTRILVEGDAETDIPLADALASLERILDVDLALMLDGYWDALLDEKAEAGTELATRLAHEIRNPLNAIGLNLTLLDRKLASELDDSSSYTSTIQAIRTELQRVDNLTKELKDYAQPISPSPDWHDFQSLIDELTAAYGPTLEANDITLEVDIQSAASDIYCDAEHLKKVLVQLLQNAVEAIDGEGRIHIEAGAENGHTILAVSDTGTGVEPTATNRAFDLFYTTKPSGTGIGLPVAKKIIEAHDGDVALMHESEPGTTIRITLPRPTPRAEVN